MRYFIEIFLIFSFLNSRIFAHAILLSSHVQDAETGEALPYVSIYTGEGKGTITNNDGDFCIKVDLNHALKISCIGYEEVKLEASKCPKVVKLKPLAHELQEVTVIPVVNILKNLHKNLLAEYKAKKNNHGNYFYRMTSTYSDKCELVEAFLDAYCAVNLRRISFISGRKGQVVGSGLRQSRISATNLHHSLELGLLIKENTFWHSLYTPFMPVWSSTSFNYKYDYSCSRITSSKGKTLMYCIHFVSKNPKRQSLEGKLYISADDYRLLRFDGSVKGMTMELLKDLRTMSDDVTLDVHINYDHQKGYTRVSDISTTLKSGDLTCKSLAFDIENRNLRHKKSLEVEENMFNSIDAVGYDSLLWTLTDIVKRTEEESRMVEKIRKEESAVSLQDTLWGDFSPLVKRLENFGKTIPQEKVYVHMDNTCYFLGDTIWFSAYMRQTSDTKPSNISHVLYVELLNNDGYLVERKLIEMNNGNGNGFFALNKNIQYAGFYELRAYTRWQLNWGQTMRNSSPYAPRWFINREAYSLYYRDYEKLYSRVFPIYDKPKEEGEYNHEMTMRPLRRSFKNNPDKRSLRLSLYPEGGNLIANISCRVAFEAAWDDGEYVNGWLYVGNDSARTQNRGRGIISITPSLNDTRIASFISDQGERIAINLPEVMDSGVSINVFQGAKDWVIRPSLSAHLVPDSLAMTVLGEGRLEAFYKLSERGPDSLFHFSTKKPGVHQITVFDKKGNVYADRLFFSRGNGELGSNVEIIGTKRQYQPHEKITLTFEGQPSATIERNLSLSVKETSRQDYLFDNGDILTEMLLGSEIRGFIPDPRWYFEKDDEEHRNAMDLLMLTQGWRRFNWQDMAIRGKWDLSQKDERAPIIQGYITKAPHLVYDYYHPQGVEWRQEMLELDSIEGSGTKLNSDFKDWNENAVKSRPLRVHAELVEPGTDKTIVSEIDTDNGHFSLQLPNFQGKRILFMTAADIMKIKSPNHVWIHMATDWEDLPEHGTPKWMLNQADYDIHVVQPYPRFVTQYNYYQNHLNIAHQPKSTEEVSLPDSVHLLNEVTVKTKYGMLRRFRDDAPVLELDAYESYNNTLDAGLLYPRDFKTHARTVVGDYGISSPYIHGENPGSKAVPVMLTNDNIAIVYGPCSWRRVINYPDIPKDSIYAPKYLTSTTMRPADDYWNIDEVRQGGGNIMSPEEAQEYNSLSKIDRVFLYTDFSPRLMGSKRYDGANLPETRIAIYPDPDGNRRAVYRDRCLILQGFDKPAEFYSPDYSKQTPPEPTDYRRTLYWNPNLKLDENGEATITFYNNSRTTHLSVEAEGQAADGTLLWGKTE